VKKLLIVKTSAFGDVIQTFYVIEDVRRLRPDCRIFWCVDSRFEGLVNLHPGVVRAIGLPLERWKSNWYNPATWVSILKFTKEIRQIDFDIALDLQGMYKSALICFLSGAKRKIGRTNFSSVEGFSNLFLNELYDLTREKGLAGRLRAFAGTALGYSHKNLKLQSGLQSKTTGSSEICFIIGASAENKKWPKYRWREVLALFLSDEYFDNFNFFILWGNSQEKQTAEWLSRQAARVTIADSMKTTVQLASYFRSCKLVLGVDTGPNHLAAALGVSVVMIFGRTSPEHNSGSDLESLRSVGDGQCWPSAAEVFTVSKLALSHAPTH